MRIGRTLPPAAAPLKWIDILSGLRGWGSGQEEIARFNKELLEYFQVDDCFLVSSGKAALSLALLALKDMHPGRDEVLIPAYTCYSIPSSVVRSGLKVRLCDVDPATYDFDYGQLQEKLKNDRLLCVVSNHLFGVPADVKRLKDLVGDSAVTVIEDAAQAFGGRSNNQKLGTLGDIGIFSLGRGKAFSTVEGGILVTSRADIAVQIEQIYAKQPDYSFVECILLAICSIAMKCLMYPEIYWIPKSLPFLNIGKTIYDPDFKIRRLSSLQAGFARGWQHRIEAFREERNEKSRHWAMFLDNNELHNFYNKPNALPDLIRFPLIFSQASVREYIFSLSEERGLGVSPTYPASIASIDEIKEMVSGEDFPAAEQCAEQILTLPVHSLMRSDDLRNIQDVFMHAKCLKENDSHD